MPFHHQQYSWVYPFYYSDLVLAGLAIVLVEVEAGWLAIEAIEVVDLIQEPYWVVGNMGLGKMGLELDAAGIGDRLKVVDRAANKPADMSGYHGHNLSNLE